LKLKLTVWIVFLLKGSYSRRWRH